MAETDSPVREVSGAKQGRFTLSLSRLIELGLITEGEVLFYKVRFENTSNRSYALDAVLPMRTLLAALLQRLIGCAPGKRGSARGRNRHSDWNSDRGP